MAIVLPATVTQPPIADGTVVGMYNRGAATAYTPAGAPAPLESQTVSGGLCTFTTPADRTAYAFAVVGGGMSRWVLKSN